MMDFTNMRPSDALEKAHEAYSLVRWDWEKVIGETCLCAVGLLGMAMGERGYVDRYAAVAAAFPTIPDELAEYRECDWTTANTLSQATHEARSFPEAIQLLRDAGW